jgi:hypothetical protein
MLGKEDTLLPHFQFIFALIILDMGVSRTICLSWHRTWILISASQVGKIVSVNHGYLARHKSFDPHTIIIIMMN